MPARIRTVKPDLAKHEGLFDLEQETGLPIRFAWAMLPSICDREGRFKWRPRTLKSEILPHDTIDFEHVLDALLTRGQLVKYRCGTEWYGWIPTFTEHQHINGQEKGSKIPAPKKADEIIDYNQQHTNTSTTRQQHVKDASSTREVNLPDGREWNRKGKEGNGIGREQEGVEVLPSGYTDIILKNGRLYTITHNMIEDWRKQFDKISIEDEVTACALWNKNNPSKRKTERGIVKHVETWLVTAQRRMQEGGSKDTNEEVFKRFMEADI